MMRGLGMTSQCCIYFVKIFLHSFLKKDVCLNCWYSANAFFKPSTHFVVVICEGVFL